MEKTITFYFSFCEVVKSKFSFCEVVKGKSKKEIIKKAEDMAEKELGTDCWQYFDDRTIE